MNSTNNPPLLIVGLGNPDSKLLKTRHNIGFWFLDLFVEQFNLSFNDNLKKGYLDSTYQDDNSTIKLLPTSFPVQFLTIFYVWLPFAIALKSINQCYVSFIKLFRHTTIFP